MKAPNIKPLTILALAGLGSLFFTGCADDHETASYRGRPAYYDEGPGPGPGPGAYDDGGYDDGADDFYYVGGVPYSHSYGVLVLRDGGYYYRHGGSYVVYNRGGHHHGGNSRDRSYADRGGDRRDDHRYDNGKYDNHGREKYIKYDSHGRPKSPQGVQNQAVVNQRYQQQRYQQQQQQRGGFQRAGVQGAHGQLTPQQQAALAAKRKKHPQPQQ